LAARDPEGDRWFRSVERQLREMGMDGEVEETPDTFGTDTRLESPAFYFGWYAPGINGPFLRDDFAFPAGAIAMHLHSYSAQTLHSDQAGWCGPLVARGVAATMGNVFEPYLGLVHRPDLLVQALRQGLPLGDAAYFALPALSWQAVLIGDPLYRPWGKTPRPAVKPPHATNVAP
jgi:uncharacterized protein (TIGR03790 family)